MNGKSPDACDGEREVATALLLVLHGSPRPEANQPALRIAELIRLRNSYSLVVVAYLECNEPSIPDALDRCANEGISRIIVVPYFLHAGRHLVLDIPALLLAGAARHPRMQIQLCDPLGNSPLITEALAARAKEAVVK